MSDARVIGRLLSKRSMLQQGLRLRTSARSLDGPNCGNLSNSGHTARVLRFSLTTRRKRGETIGTHGPIERARPLLEAMIQEVTGAKVLSLHHDISTVTGEEVVVFTLVGVLELHEIVRK